MPARRPLTAPGALLAALLLGLAALSPAQLAAQGKPGSAARADTARKPERGRTARAADDSAQTAAMPDPLAGRVRGSASAPITVYEMSDFQCPYCRTFALNTFPALDSLYIATGKVRWAFINFPLTSIHENALAAAELAVCAARQNAFWRVHDLLYQYQETWAPLKQPGAFFLSLADSARISRPALLACVKADSTRETVRQEAEGAERAGATSTPSFYIEGGLLAGAQPLSVFRQVLDSIIRVKQR